MEELGALLESMGFKEGNMPETWKGIFEGIQLSICVHPFKGISLSFYNVGKRTASEGEMSIPHNSNKQQIAKSLVQIYEVYSK